jgi:hypothetical protein
MVQKEDATVRPWEAPTRVAGVMAWRFLALCQVVTHICIVTLLIMSLYDQCVGVTSVECPKFKQKQLILQS